MVTAIVVVILVFAVALLGTAWLPQAITGRVQDLGGYFGGPDPARTEITDENFSVLERLAHWQAGLKMLEDQPWLGVGIGNYGTAYSRYPQPHWYEPLGHAHNVFINFAAETGIVGLAAFLVFWLSVAYWAVRKGWNGPGWINALAVGVFGTWTYLTVHGLFDNLFVQHFAAAARASPGGVLPASAIPTGTRKWPRNCPSHHPCQMRRHNLSPRCSGCQ